MISNPAEAQPRGSYLPLAPGQGCPGLPGSTPWPNKCPPGRTAMSPQARVPCSLQSCATQHVGPQAVPQRAGLGGLGCNPKVIGRDLACPLWVTRFGDESPK